MKDDRADRAEREIEAIRSRWPEEFRDGARRALLRAGGYPSGFHEWPLDRRNAWFAGFNVGYCERKEAGK
jgi:hypothetical protein